MSNESYPEKELLGLVEIWHNNKSGRREGPVERSMFRTLAFMFETDILHKVKNFLIQLYVAIAINKEWWVYCISIKLHCVSHL